MRVNKIFLIITALSFLSFIGLTLVMPWSRFLFFNYFLKERVNQLVLGFIVITGFSSVLGITTAYVIKNYNVMDKRVFLTILGVSFIASFVLMLGRTSYSVFSYTEMNGFFYTLTNFVLLAPMIPLTSFVFSNLFQSFKNVKFSGNGILGSLIAAFSLGCPSCGAILYSLLGITSGLTIFPLKGTEVKIFSLALLVFATKKMNEKSCSTKKTKIVEQFNIFDSNLESVMLVVIILTGGLLFLNQLQISAVSHSLDVVTGKASRIDLKGVDVSTLKATAMTVAAVFPELKNVKTEEEVMSVMLASGTPEYSELLGGVTFDDPVTSLSYLSKWYYSLKEDVKNNDPETWQRYLSLAAAPRGISCEFCCGVGPQGIDSQGNLRCGCKHNPALQAVALGLIKYTDYSDAQILREVMKWKTVFFPRNMVALGFQVAGQDPSQIKSLPGMVGGC